LRPASSGGPIPSDSFSLEEKATVSNLDRREIYDILLLEGAIRFWSS
jgi:hypothetical protein